MPPLFHSNIARMIALLIVLEYTVVLFSVK